MSNPTVLSSLVQALKAVAQYNRQDQIGPVAILWTDKDRQWEELMPKLREEMDVLTLGTYDPKQGTGPSYWIRCRLGRAIPDEILREGSVPIIYFPGYSREELRAVEDCPKELQPLAELQYRGIWWTQQSTKDWTILSYLRNKEVGLGLDVSSDQATLAALRGALVELAGELVDRLRQMGQINAADLNALLDPDPEKSVLLWMDEPENFRTRRDGAKWQAFCETCQSKFGFHPERDTPVSAAERLGSQQGEWKQVWDRFAEAPKNYPHIPDVLRQARPGELFVSKPESWPQDNEGQEEKLRTALRGFADKHPDAARKEIEELWNEHGVREQWVWGKLGLAPLTKALDQLRELAASTFPLTGATLEELVTSYTKEGWKADAAALRALGEVQKAEDVDAVKAVLASIYRPWLDGAATTFQEKIGRAYVSYPRQEMQDIPPSTCILFSDALRFDLAMQLQVLLAADDCLTELTPTLAALPTLTPTAKPAISPIAHMFVGSVGFSPSKSKGGAPLTSDAFATALTEAGYQVLRGDETGDPAGLGWTEIGAIDIYGHNNQWKVAHRALEELRSIAHRVRSLLEAGWARVIVVTDHGWLLVPGELPKVELPAHLTESRKGRCARLKEGVSVDYRTVKWYWDPEVSIAIAPGISSFVAGKEYDHGGVSPQECVVAVLKASLKTTRKPVSIESHEWVGLRCRIRLSGEFGNCVVDIRNKAGDSTSSVVTEPKPADQDGVASLLVEDDTREGEAAFIVALVDGRVVSQTTTTIGGQR